MDLDSVVTLQQVVLECAFGAAFNPLPVQVEEINEAAAGPCAIAGLETETASIVQLEVDVADGFVGIQAHIRRGLAAARAGVQRRSRQSVWGFRDF